MKTQRNKIIVLEGITSTTNVQLQSLFRAWIDAARFREESDFTLTQNPKVQEVKSPKARKPQLASFECEN